MMFPSRVTRPYLLGLSTDVSRVEVIPGTLVPGDTTEAPEHGVGETVSPALCPTSPRHIILLDVPKVRNLHILLSRSDPAFRDVVEPCAEADITAGGQLDAPGPIKRKACSPRLVTRSAKAFIFLPSPS